MPGRACIDAVQNGAALTHGPTLQGITERNRMECQGRWRGARPPGGPAVHAAQDRATLPRYPEARRIYARQRSQMVSAATRNAAPGVATIAAPQDHTTLTDSNAVQSIGETDGVEPRGLGLHQVPAHSAVARRDDDAAIANRPGPVRIHRIDTSQGAYRAGLLRTPAQTRVVRLAHDSAVADDPASIA